MFVGASGIPIVQRGLIAFDLNAIPAGSTINSATLTMDVNRTSSSFTGSMNIDLMRLSSNWGEVASHPQVRIAVVVIVLPSLSALPHGIIIFFLPEAGIRLVVTSWFHPVPLQP